jgi:hypothetical protein
LGTNNEHHSFSAQAATTATRASAAADKARETQASKNIFYPKVFTELELETSTPQNTKAPKTQSNINIFFPINQSIYGYSITRFSGIVKHTLL